MLKRMLALGLVVMVAVGAVVLMATWRYEWAGEAALILGSIAAMVAVSIGVVAELFMSLNRQNQPPPPSPLPRAVTKRPSR